MVKQSVRNPRRETRDEILEQAAQLFARLGFDGVSMRDIAAVGGVTPAALYNHFSSKEQLYLDVIAFAFEDKVKPLMSLLVEAGNPWTRLEAFAVQLTNVLTVEKDFRRLMQWVMLDNDEQRLQGVGQRVFGDLFNALRNLFDELAPAANSHRLAVSTFGLIIYPFETESLRHFLPGYEQQEETPEALARHVIGLLRNGLA